MKEGSDQIYSQFYLRFAQAAQPPIVSWIYVSDAHLDYSQMAAASLKPE